MFLFYYYIHPPISKGLRETSGSIVLCKNGETINIQFKA